jgi:hypothetical protein
METERFKKRSKLADGINLLLIDLGSKKWAKSKKIIITENQN